MSDSNILELYVPNFNKHNVRNDRPNYNWFKMYSSFFQDAVVFDLPAGAKLLLIHCYGLQNMSGNKPFKFNLSQNSVLLGLKPVDVIKYLKTLEDIGMVTGGSRLVDSPQPLVCLEREEKKERKPWLSYQHGNEVPLFGKARLPFAPCE